MKRSSNRENNRRSSGRAVEDSLMLLAGIGAGLGAMYLLDPHHGRQRRQRVARVAGAAMETAGQSLGSAWNHVSSAASEAASDVRDRGGEIAENLTERARRYIPESFRPEPEHHYLGQTACAVGSMLLGAGVTYLLDPELGRERRTRLFDLAGGAVRNTADFFVCAFRSVTDRFGMQDRGREGSGESDQTRTTPMSESATAP